ncbi:hypothetical protein E2C01_093255 [Portunus trituberculatus]|uniref:Uncharacterized protein n=1 Tax=Portunus trituberculatus TaxID=210409 RepID=A0A5B7JPA9_PORTR|nr:hypothetical protein [Portunus trituberculatus]
MQVAIAKYFLLFLRHQQGGSVFKEVAVKTLTTTATLPSFSILESQLSATDSEAIKLAITETHCWGIDSVTGMGWEIARRFANRFHQQSWGNMCRPRYFLPKRSLAPPTGAIRNVSVQKGNSKWMNVS